MYFCPRDKDKKSYPKRYVPVDKIEFVLKEIGFTYIAVNKRHKIRQNLIELDNRDRSKGNDYVCFDDIKRFLEKYIHKYTNKKKVMEAVSFFDTDNDQVIS